MIAACPGCGARYRVDSSRVGPRGARVRCGRCEEIFRVEADGNRAGHFLLADADAERAKQIPASPSENPICVSVVHDGVEALVDVLRAPPALAVFDENLPRISGFSLCDVLKRDPVLSQIHVVLGVSEEGVAAAAPGDVEPDSIVTWDDLGGWLVNRLDENEPTNARAGGHGRTDSLLHGRVADEGDDLEKERVSAERLARIVVSDIVLYDPERFDRAARVGRLMEALAAELREGRALLERRIDSRVLGERDFLADEVARVIRTRRSPDVPG